MPEVDTHERVPPVEQDAAEAASAEMDTEGEMETAAERNERVLAEKRAAIWRWVIEVEEWPEYERDPDPEEEEAWQRF